MSTLLEITNTAREVEIDGKTLQVYPVSLEVIAGLMVRFPEIKQLMSGATVTQGEAAQAVIAVAPRAVSAVIAAGCGKPGDEEYERAAARLGVGPQLEILEAVLTATFPRGLGPFVEGLIRLGIARRVFAQDETARQ